MYCPKIELLDGVQKLARLEEFHLHGARRLRSILPLGKCKRLRKVDVQNIGRLDSLAPLRTLNCLEELYVPGVRVDDGDLSWVLLLPKLRLFAIAQQRHLVPSPELIDREIDARLQLE